MPGAVLLALLPALPARGQDKNIVLSKGIPVSEVLKTGEKHRYSVKMDANMFAYFVLIQDGVDALITTFDPDGKRISGFDSPNGRKGPEPVVLFSDKKGDYILEVTALEEKGHQGKYSLTWEKLESRGSTPEKQIDQYFTAWNSLASPGAAVAVEKDGKVIFKKGYGSAELEYNIPITPQTVFHIASVSKQFTCFSILLLEKEGKLSTDDDVRKYIPEVPDFGRPLTLNNLMHHTSGLRDQWELLAMAGWRLDDNITKDHILRLISRQKALNFIPGEEFLYCNTGFTLLAEVVARVSGQTFAEFTKAHIFEPLKMTNTLFYDDCEKIVKNRAYSFSLDSTGYKKSNLNYSNVGATSLFTTVEDLCKWAANFENPVVGDDRIVRKMEQRGILNNGDTISYAMGQDISRYKGLKIISHGGADAGYRTFLVRFPDQKFSVNVLSNYAGFNPGDLAFKVADIYLKDKEVKETPKQAGPDNATSANNVEYKVPHDLLIAYCGKYEIQPGNVVTISLENETLYASAQDLEQTPMTPVAEDQFDVKQVAAKVTFLKDESGKYSKMKVNMEGQEVIVNKLPDFDPAKVDLTEFTGDFFSPELNTTYSLLIDNGKLIARHFRTGDVKLTATKPDNFSGNQWYFSKIEFSRSQAGKVDGLKVTGGRVRNLKFTKVE